MAEIKTQWGDVITGHVTEVRPGVITIGSTPGGPQLEVCLDPEEARRVAETVSPQVREVLLKNRGL